MLLPLDAAPSGGFSSRRRVPVTTCSGGVVDIACSTSLDKVLASDMLALYLADSRTALLAIIWDAVPAGRKIPA